MRLPAETSKQHTQTSPGRNSEKNDAELHREMSNTSKDRSWRLIDFCLFGLTRSLKQFGLVHSLRPLNYRCSSSRSAGCAGILFFLKDMTTRCGGGKKMRGRETSFIMIRTAALTRAMWQHTCCTEDIFSAGRWFTVFREAAVTLEDAGCVRTGDHAAERRKQLSLQTHHPC